MSMKNNAEFGEELACHFKIDMRNLTNFGSSTCKSRKPFSVIDSFEQSI